MWFLKSWRLCLAVTAACVLISVGHFVYGHFCLGVSFALAAHLGFLTTAVVISEPEAESKS